MSELEEGRDFIFNIPEDKTSPITINIISGDYRGVTYNYGTVSGEEDKENGEFYLSFNFDIVENNGHVSLEENIEFKNYIGDILTTIITKNANIESEVIEETEYNEIGTDNT
jgi:hypothetical protein